MVGKVAPEERFCIIPDSVWNQKEINIRHTMRIRKAYRYELMPKGGDIRKMKRFCGYARFVFNRALAYQQKIARHKQNSGAKHVDLRKTPTWLAR